MKQRKQRKRRKSKKLVIWIVVFTKGRKIKRPEK
jgi:hypothetical protein